MNYDGVSSQALAARLETPLLLCVDEVPSVLDLVHELAADGADAGWVVLSDTQTAGRGRQGRRWVSPRGAGIWLGYLFRPGHTLEGGVLSLRVGLTAARALDALGVAVSIKWPNDILLSDRKLAGVLCEARGSGPTGWVAIGIGMNVCGPVLPEVADVAVSRFWSS
jgi:BirA family biotin operon repressor/biotin-[acetyl-CoA-carboxylase] ligase